VDDEPLVRGLTLEVLRREGFRVEVADDGAEALRFMRDSDLHVDMLVTDLLMPGVGGRELAEHLRRGRPGLPVLFVSGFAGAEDLPEVGPNSALLAKPFSAAGLVAAVRELLAGSPEAR
jgi:CheY-like chemotaxis protein